MPQEPNPTDTLLKKISLNVDRADYDWLKDNIDELKRLRILPARATITDVINEGFQLRLAQLQSAYDLTKRPKK